MTSHRQILIVFLIFMTGFLFNELLYFLRSRGDEIHSSSKLEYIGSSYSHSSFNFSYSSTNKLVKDTYEAGHLITNPDLCPDFGKNMKLMILVTSTLNHSDARMAIRQTWGFYSRHHNVGIGFLVGDYRQPSQNSIIQIEQRTYGDLIQARNVDSYNNLTLKTVSLLEWVHTYCSQVPFVLKADNDMFINIPLLLTLLEKHQLTKRSIFGRLASKWRPCRQTDSKYFLNKSEYEPDTFPDFLTGPAYLMTQDSVHDLYHQALKMPFLKLEDVFITGHVADSIGVERINVTEFCNQRIPFNITRMREIISIHEITPREQFFLWAFIRPVLSNN